MRGSSKIKDQKHQKKSERKEYIAPLGILEKSEGGDPFNDEEATKLKEDVKTINIKMMADGERLFFTQIPQKIVELTEYIKKQPLFRLSFADIKQEISVDQYVLAYQAELAEKELLRYVKSTHNSYDEWRKEQKCISLANDHNNPTEVVVIADVTKIDKKDNSLKRNREEMNDVSPSKKQKTEEEVIKKEKKPIVFPKECSIPINAHLADMMEFLKKEVRDCIVLCSAIKMWITLRLPRMEDGTDLGVAIQEEFLDSVTEVEDEAYGILDSISTYHSTRGNYIVQMMSNPSIKDYSKCIAQVDETQFFNTKLSIIDFRNNYALLFDMVMKNKEKLQAPVVAVDSMNSFY